MGKGSWIVSISILVALVAIYFTDFLGIKSKLFPTTRTTGGNSTTINSTSNSPIGTSPSDLYDPTNPSLPGSNFIRDNFPGGYGAWVNKYWDKLETIGTMGKVRPFGSLGINQPIYPAQFYGELHWCGTSSLWCHWWYYETPEGSIKKRTPHDFYFSKQVAVHRIEIRTREGNYSILDKNKPFLLSLVSYSDPYGANPNNAANDGVWLITT